MRHLQTFTDHELARERAAARNRRDAYALGREPAEVLERVMRADRETEARRLLRRANRRVDAARKVADR